MDRSVVASCLRRAYAHARSNSDRYSSEIIIGELRAIAIEVLGHSFSFEPDFDCTTDATPARLASLRPVSSADPHERPSDRYIDEPAFDDAPKAG